ncbi:MAG: hypothetical protein B6I36_01405 [Desulfobacteraceae bacterium 4572_35.1]|nr:MAG: hypothetical protein B6I36_01405 [Desulfobacteraceae bacterium 4572_35.1]
MLDTYEKAALRRYLRNVLFDQRTTQKMSAAICDWLEDNLELVIDSEIAETTWDILEEYNRSMQDHCNTKSRQKAFLSEMERLLSLEDTASETAVLSQLEQNISTLADMLKFDEIDKAIFALLARYKAYDKYEGLLNDLGKAGSTQVLIISLLTQLDIQLVTKRLGIGSRLIVSGVVEICSRSYHGTDLDDRFEIPDNITRALVETMDSNDDIRTHILGTPVNAVLEWEDFAHLGEICGKTEFCKTLAKQINCNLYSVGETDDDGDAPSKNERISSLRLNQSILQYQNNNLLMFDEMDDLFEQSAFTAMFGGKLQFSSKIFTNRLFEHNTVPTIWIINDASILDETIVRRMSLVLEIKSPPKSTREKVMTRIIAKHGLDLPEQAICELKNLDAAPAILDNAVRFAQINGQGVDDIMFAFQGIVEAIKGKKLAQKNQHKISYCPELVNADMDLNDLGGRLLATGQKQFSLCLYGPPGTGKTEYVRQLADQLGMEVLVKRASDLLGAYVGQSEQQIAAAFQQAQDKEQFLIFDEADSLLGDRRHAHQSWEVSQVNEMLTWMENHQLPFACTTNLMDRLDQASLRRFTFKVGFNHLTNAQSCFAFRYFFNIDAPTSIKDLTNLTPGDFMVVQKKANILGLIDQPLELVKMLEVECSVKENTSTPIGFLAA